MAQLRAMRTVEVLINKHPDQVIVLVSHTALNRLILLSALGPGLERFWNLRQDTCAVNVLETGQAGYIVHSLNNTAHLLDDMFGKNANDNIQTL